MIGVGLSVPQIAGASTAFSPASLFGVGEQGAWYDPSDFSTMFKDTAGTDPVTAAGDAVALIRDKSGRGNHASQGVLASRPLLQQDASGLWYLSFDGSNDSLATSSVNFTGTDKVTIFAGLRKLADAGSAVVCELSTAVAANNASFALFAPITAAPNYSPNSKGTLGSTPVSSTFAAPDTAVLTMRADIAGDVCNLRRNGTQIANATTDQGSGNYGNYPLYIGSRASSSLRFNGRIYSLIVRGAASSAAEIAATEAWVNSKTGAY